ncbi:MAG: histidine kinase [bacterium]|nr:histidine kinase [bacterium]
MGKSFFELEQSIKFQVNNASELALQSSRIDQKVEKYLQHTLHLLLERFGRGDLLDMVYTITKELTINGVKANHKRLFFEEHGYDLEDTSRYEAGVAAFRGEFSDEMNEHWGRVALERGIYVKIHLTYDESGLCIEVINNTPIAEIEESRMREKFKKSMGYSDIAEFYMDNMDNTEGAGLGIALIMILMKGEGLDPNLFRIYTKPDSTIARVEIPFGEDYVSRRSREGMETAAHALD